MSRNHNMVCQNPEKSKTIESILTRFNVSTLDIMEKYRTPAEKKKCDKELRKLCYDNTLLLDYPKLAGKKVVDFIKYYTNP